MDTPVIGFDGSTVAGYELDGGLTLFSGRQFLGFAGADASDDLQILDATGEVVWRAECSVRLDPSRVPDAWMVCLYRSARREAPTLTFAATAVGERPLTGAFLAGDEAWLVEGSRTSALGLDLPDTLSWVVRRPTEREWRLWVDQTGGYPEVHGTADLTAADLRQLAPLLLTFVKMRDARYMFRQSNADFTPAPDATAFAGPAPLPAKPTDQERHAAALVALGFREAASVVLAVARGEVE